MKLALSRRPAVRSAAFTLLEVMIGASVAAVVMVAAFASVASGFQVMKLTRENLRATQILMDRLETVRLCTWQQLTNLPLTFTNYYTPLEMDPSGGGVTYYGDVSISPFSLDPTAPPTYTDELAYVQITLRWTNVHSATTINAAPGASSSGSQLVLARSRTMSTLLTRHGLQSYIVRMQ